MDVKNRDSVAVDRNADEEFDFLDENINLAVKNAQQNLVALGIGYVYSIDNLVIQHNSDGSEDILQSIDLDPDDRLIAVRCRRV